MAIAWRFSRSPRTGVLPAIRDQLVDVDHDAFSLRNPWVRDSVFMGNGSSFVGLAARRCNILNYRSISYDARERRKI